MKIDIEERSKSARKLFESGYNCAQSVAMTYSDICEIDIQVIEKLSLAFGGGLGRQREVCGTVSGASMVLGTVMSNKGGDAKSASYKLIQDFSGRFKQENGSIICRELLSLGKGENANPEPTPRSDSYYKKRPCGEYVEISARLVGEILQSL